LILPWYNETIQFGGDEPINERLAKVEVVLESEIKPNIKLLAENYIPAASRYERATNEFENMRNDVELLKKVVSEHSEKLQKIT